jgi:hypothetical protein
MNGAANPRDSAHWRLAVWGLRVMGSGLAVVGVGLVTLLWSTIAGQAFLAVGMGIYLVAVVTTVVGIVLVYREVPPPRPNLIWLRWSLLHDAVHTRSASTDHASEGSSPVAAGRTQSPLIESLRHSAHWRLAVRGYRVMGTGLAVVVAGFTTFLWSRTAGLVVLAVGFGIYFVSVVFTFVEVHRACDDVQPPRPDYALVQQRLLHDALHARS